MTFSALRLRMVTLGTVILLAGCGGDDVPTTPTPPAARQYPITAVAKQISISRFPIDIGFSNGPNTVLVLSAQRDSGGTVVRQGTATGLPLFADFASLASQAGTNLAHFGTQNEIFEVYNRGVLLYRITTQRAAPATNTGIFAYRVGSETDALVRARWEAFARDTLPGLRFRIVEP